MFTFGSVVSLQPHQVFLPFGHFASVLTGVRNTSGEVKRRRRRSKGNDLQEDGKECLDSLIEAVRNCADSSIHQELCRQRVWDHLPCLLSVDLPQPPGGHPSAAPWTVSHVSSKTFFENKHGFPESGLQPSPISTGGLPLTRQILNNAAALLASSSQNFAFSHVPTRGFKTRTQRVTTTSLLGQAHSESASVGERLLGHKTKIEKDRTKVLTDAEQKGRLKSLISEENLSAEEQQRLKVAFAEGYSAAELKIKVGKHGRHFSVIRVTVLVVVVLGVLLCLMALLSVGTFKRVLIGSANEVHPEEIDVTFEDVKGVDEAKQELKEIVEFLKNPDKFSALGGKLPKGVLLVGPPGTGKTLLARAVAGEANVPFFHAAGPEFDELLVGQGARRVRDLFNTAKMKAPCVIFIDEIDSVGAKRTSSMLHPYANQTINQLLTEMDGFRQNEGVIVLGATNRKGDLDKALMRPGRFDVQVQVPIPDLAGRKEILGLYLGKVKVSDNVDKDVLGRGTSGFTGADLENMVNQAALRAAIDGASVVSMFYLENARDRILMGPECKSRIQDDEDKKITAYHEGGHTLVAYYTKGAFPLHKVTIVPRGPSLGHTAFIPEKEQYHINKTQMLARMDVLMAGRAAEELIFGAEKITSGAASDLDQATGLATQMVKEWGMSEKVGMRTFNEANDSLVVVNKLAASTSEAIDSEIKRLLCESYERAKNILRSHSKEHKLLAESLLKNETLDVSDIKMILGGGGEAERKLPNLSPPTASLPHH